MPISLKAASGGGLMKPAANQTFEGSLGIGGIVVPLANVSTATNMLVLNGKYALRALTLSYLAGASSNITITLTIDGRPVLNATVIPVGTESGTLNLFNNLSIGSSGDALEVNSNLTLNVHRSTTVQVSLTGNAIALV